MNLKSTAVTMMLAVLVPLLSTVAAAVPMDELIKKEQASVDNEAVVVYGGKVGNLQAVFFLEWSGVGNPVNGYYFHPERGRAKTYKLEGSNPKEGVLNLKEFTVGKNGSVAESANCRLTKSVEGNRIVWKGIMNNTDGRKLPIEFSRPR